MTPRQRRLPRSALALLAALAACRPASGVGSGTLASEAAYAEAPLEYDGVYAVTLVAAGHRRSLRFVVDLAASVSAISPATRDALGSSAMREAGRATVAGGVGQGSHEAVVLDSLRVGGLLRENVRVVVLPELERFQRAGARPYAGILGQDVLWEFDVEIDLPSHRLRLYPRRPSGAGRRPVPGAASALACVPRLPADSGWVVFDASFGGRPVLAILDTGAPTTIVNWSAAREAGLGDRSPRVRRHMAGTRGVGAADAVETHTVDRVAVAVAGTPLSAGPVRIADLPLLDLLGVGSRPTMILGVDRLRDRALFVSHSTREVCFATATHQHK